MRLTLAEVAEATGGRLVGPDATVQGATIDSREVRPGQLFVPVVAVRDGHAWVRQALAAGAGGYLTHLPAQGGSAVVVGDTGAALHALGVHARTRLPDAVVGVTGSVGKTSVKDLAAAAIGADRPTAASARSFNNELGVPLTLLEAPEGTAAVVVEMGMRGFGHIAELCALARPTVGVVTQLAAAHTEQVGGIEGVARAKGELVEALPAGGTAVLNAEQPLVLAMASRGPAQVLTFGTGATPADVVGELLQLDDDLRPVVRLRSPSGAVEVQLEARGAHQAANAAAALAAALALGVPLARAAEGLAAARPSAWRMELGATAGGARVLNDAYNANPTSMAAALHALAALPATRRRAVVGVMAELGADAAAHHEAVAALAAELGVELLAVGTDLYGVAPLPDVAAAARALGELGPGDAVLVKGSRVAGLERLAAQLLA